MTIKNRVDLENSILQGLKEILAYKKGTADLTKYKVHTYEVPKEVDVKAIRKKLKMTQEEFTKFGFSISAIRHWENKRRKPDGAARVLLKVIEQNPKVVLDSLKKIG